jgi:hypothetical protein
VCISGHRVRRKQISTTETHGFDESRRLGQCKCNVPGSSHLKSAGQADRRAGKQAAERRSSPGQASPHSANAGIYPVIIHTRTASNKS